MAEVKNRVRELRRAAGLSVEDLEGMTDVSAYIIKSMESGHTGVHADNAYKLAQYFGVSMEYLCGYSDDGRPAYQEFEDLGYTAMDELDEEFANDLGDRVKFCDGYVEFYQCGEIFKIETGDLKAIVKRIQEMEVAPNA